MLYNQLVRRIFAIVLALLTGLPAITPLFALGTADDASRPACCRRSGKHHCMLTDMEMGASSSSIGTGTRMSPVSLSERCPYGSKTLPGRTFSDWSLDTGAAIFSGIVAHPAVAPQIESKRRISADRARQKRGPPPSLATA